MVMRDLRLRLVGRTVLLITHRETLVSKDDLVWRMGEPKPGR
jgi:ATP-binding cassette subfamily C protein CydC